MDLCEREKISEHVGENDPKINPSLKKASVFYP